MSQPEWKLLFSTDYSALYTDTTGVYHPELVIAQEYETERGTTRWQVYRFSLERCYQVTDEDGSTFLTDMDPTTANLPYPLTKYVPWFRDDIGSIAKSCGATAAELVSLLCSDVPQELAQAYEMIGGYHGYANLDSEPSDWTESEMADFPERGKMSIRIETSDDDNGMVTLYCDDQEACRDDQSVEGSRWETPGDMDIGYASVMDHPGLLASLEKEYDVDSSEYSPPEPEDLARWHAKYLADGGS